MTRKAQAIRFDAARTVHFCSLLAKVIKSEQNPGRSSDILSLEARSGAAIEAKLLNRGFQTITA